MTVSQLDYSQGHISLHYTKPAAAQRQ